MLAEGFLRILRYREERKLASSSKLKRLQTHDHFMDPIARNFSILDATDQQADSAEAGKLQ